MSAEELRRALSGRMFKGDIVENRWRGDLVEEIVSQTIDRSVWSHCSENWNSWDFEQVSGPLRMQVKQAALRQTWSKTPTPIAAVRFGIKKAKGWYDGSEWKQLLEPGRIAEIYLFAFHPDGSENANHWDANAWKFYGLREVDLPCKESISLCEVKKTAAVMGFEGITIGELEGDLSDLVSKTITNRRVAEANATDPDVGDAEAPDEAG